MSNLQEIGTDPTQLREFAKIEPDILFGIAMPEDVTLFLPPILRDAWFWLTQEVQKIGTLSLFALGLPRGFGKTTLIKVFVLYSILFTSKNFILIVSKTQAMADNIISDIVDMLEEPNIIALFGDYRHGIEKDTQHLKKFSFRGRDVIIAGVGALGTVRGLNVKNKRPDLMVLDDIQSREDADSELVSIGLYKWMMGTLLKAKSNKGCMVLFIANMYPTPHSILKKLIVNKFWVSLCCGGILQSETGEMYSLWEELRPLKDLLLEFELNKEDGTPEIFYAEVLNNPDASVNNQLDQSKIPEFIWDDYDIHAGNFIVIDPASGKRNADDVSIGYFQVHDGIPVLWDVSYGKYSPSENIKFALNFCSQYSCGLIFVESNAYQSTLCYWFDFIMKQMGIEGIEVVEIYSGRASKHTRIAGMFKQLMGGEVQLHPRTKSDVLAQALQYNPLRTDNTDGLLDLVTYAPRILREFADYIAKHTYLQASVIEAESETLAITNEADMLEFTSF